MHLSVVIPTYNGAKRLPLVLEALRKCIEYTSQHSQQRSISCEVIVVDNNSNDATARVVRDYQAQWPSHQPLRYCFEPQPGAAHARKHGVQVATANLIGFIDDDNIPEPNWLQAAYEFAIAYPEAGAFGSQIHGDFEVEPDESLVPLLPFLAIVERGDDPLLHHPRCNHLPPSAGLVVRRKAWQDAKPETCRLSGRNGSTMLTGEDVEVLARIRNAGWQVWHNPRMELQHKIPQQRLTRDYLIPFFRGIGLSRYVTRMTSRARWQRPFLFWIYLANDLRKIGFHLIRYRGKIRSDLKLRCQWALFCNSLVSPFYIWSLFLSSQFAKCWQTCRL